MSEATNTDDGVNADADNEVEESVEDLDEKLEELTPDELELAAGGARASHSSRAKGPHGKGNANFTSFTSQPFSKTRLPSFVKSKL